MANSQTNGSTISRDEGIAAPNDASQLDSAGQAILKLLDRAASAAEANRRQSLEAAQRLLVSFTPPRVGSRGWSPSFSSIERRLIAPKIGSTISPSRLRIASFAGQKRGDGESRDDHSRHLSFQS